MIDLFCLNRKFWSILQKCWWSSWWNKRSWWWDH